MNYEQEIKDLGNIVLDLAKSLRQQEKNLKDLNDLVVNTTSSNIQVMEAVRNTLVFQQEHLEELDQKFIRVNWAIESLEKK